MTKTQKILLIVAAVIVIAVSAWLLLKKKPSDQTAMPAITPADATPKPVQNDNFPLNVSSNGPNVQRLQMALNRIKPTDKLVEDGVFGSKTRVKLLTTVNTNLSKLPMDEAQLNEIIKLGNNAPN